MGDISPHTGIHRFSGYDVIVDIHQMTYAFACKIELLCLHLRKDFQELLHKANQLSGKTILILEIMGVDRISNY